MFIYLLIYIAIYYLKSLLATVPNTFWTVFGVAFCAPNIFKNGVQPFLNGSFDPWRKEGAVAPPNPCGASLYAKRANGWAIGQYVHLYTWMGLSTNLWLECSTLQWWWIYPLLVKNDTHLKAIGSIFHFAYFCGKKKHYFASSDPHHGIQFIPSDILSGIPIWHSIWHIFWHSVCHIFWNSIWHIFWPSIW